MGRKKKNEAEAFAADLHDIMDGAGTMKDTEIAEAFVAKGWRKRSKGEWISVEERWPETDGYYLVWNKEQRKIEIRFFHRLPPHYPVETYPEIRAYFGNCSDHKSRTHWMPMPEPPKGGCHE